MCYSAIFPIAIKSEQFSSDFYTLTCVFNRWLKMIKSYGRLDPSSINNDFSIIARVIKSNRVSKEIKNAVKLCRDYALGGEKGNRRLIYYLRQALNLLCIEQEDKNVSKVKANYNDQGMRVKYRPLTRRLAKEKIQRIGKEIIYTDFHTDNSETNRLVRRIVEKRAAQEVYKYAGSADKQSNRFRQSVRRAVSFSLYNSAFTDYDPQLRARGTHWKINFVGGRKRLKAKLAYNSLEEAEEACRRYRDNHPGDPRPMSAYKCDYCGKWHIGHYQNIMQLELSDGYYNEEGA